MRKLTVVFFMLFGSSAYADSSVLAIPDLYLTESTEWHGVHAQMSSQEYRKATRKNRNTAIKAVSNYVEGKFLSLGIPEKGVTAAGAVVGFAFNGAKIDLNKSKTLAFEVTDVVQQKPVLMLKMNLDW